MFLKTYKTTIKRIIRSPIFWMALGIVAVLVFLRAYRGFYLRGLNPGDREAGFILMYEKYHEMIANLLRPMMIYLIPCLCVVTVMTVVSGDYSDNFYEIERAGGVRSTTYFFGRLSAILTVLLTITLVLSFFSVHYYFFTRGGVANFTLRHPNSTEPWPFSTLGEYVIDSTKVLLRLVFLCQLPVVILFTSATYAIGAYLESGLLAGVGGSIATVIAYLVTIRYQWDRFSVVYKYFLPAKIGPYLYLSRFDTVFASEKYLLPNGTNMFLDDTLADVITWLAIMLAISLAFILVSFLCTRRRKI